jgi:lauroyl/myristoyl acyltransferase
MTTINDIEQLGYFGMRLALRENSSAPELRAYARACATRRNHNLRHWIENEELPPVAMEGLENLRKAHELNRGAVVTSFQIGSYNWIPILLNRKCQMPVSILMDAANFQEEQRRWDKREREYRESLAEPVRYINSEEPTAFWKMACSLRERRTLIGWFDGHTGVTQAEAAKSSLAVRFCGTRMRIRVGLAHLCARTGSPLILAVVRNQGEKIIAVTFEEPLRRQNDETADGFCQRAAQQLISILEREVLQDPACWEEWCHLHLWNVFDDRHGTEIYEHEFLDTHWHIDPGGADLLHMTDGDVLVSLGSGKALAMTPLLTSVYHALGTERTGRELLEFLAPQFHPDDIHNMLRVLCDEQFIGRGVRRGEQVSA